MATSQTRETRTFIRKQNSHSISTDASKLPSSHQIKHVPNDLKPTKRSPPHESFRYVKKDTQNVATQNHKPPVSSGPTGEGTTRTVRPTSPFLGAKTAASSSAKPGQERDMKASKPRKIHQLYVKKITHPDSKGVAVDPVSPADNQETMQEEAFVKDIKKVEPVEEEVTIPTEKTVESESKKVLVDASVSEGNEEEPEGKKVHICDTSTVSEEEENQSPPAVERIEGLADKEDKVEPDGNSAVSNKNDMKDGDESEETKEGDDNEKKKEEENGRGEENERKEEEENRKMVKLGSSSGGGKGKKDSPPAYNDVIEETACKLLEKEKNKVKALVGAFETVIDYESSSK